MPWQPFCSDLGASYGLVARTTRSMVVSSTRPTAWYRISSVPFVGPSPPRLLAMMSHTPPSAVPNWMSMALGSHLISFALIGGGGADGGGDGGGLGGGGDGAGDLGGGGDGSGG